VDNSRWKRVTITCTRPGFKTAVKSPRDSTGNIAALQTSSAPARTANPQHAYFSTPLFKNTEAPNKKAMTAVGVSLYPSTKLWI